MCDGDDVLLLPVMTIQDKLPLCDSDIEIEIRDLEYR